MKKQDLLKEIETQKQSLLEEIQDSLNTIKNIVNDKEEDTLLKAIQVLEISKEIDILKRAYLKQLEFVRILERVQA